MITRGLTLYEITLILIFMGRLTTEMMSVVFESIMTYIMRRTGLKANLIPPRKSLLFIGRT
nr:hypothetical protein Q903MT_gene1892 [Picea sitchensis]